MPLNPDAPQPTKKERAVAAIDRNERHIEVMAFGLAIGALVVLSGAALALGALVALTFIAGAIAESFVTRGK